MTDLDKLERLAMEATPGPWRPCLHVRDGDEGCPCGYRGDIWGESGEAVILELGPSPDCEHCQVIGRPAYPRNEQLANGRLIAAAVNALPDLIAEVRRLRGALEKIAEWDCLNPPATHLLGDLAWLKGHVRAALKGSDK